MYVYLCVCIYGFADDMAHVYIYIYMALEYARHCSTFLMYAVSSVSPTTM